MSSLGMRLYKLQYIYTQSHIQPLPSESHTSYNTCIFSLIPKSCATVQPHTQAQLQHVYSDSYPSLVPESHSVSYLTLYQSHSALYPSLVPESHSASYLTLYQSPILPYTQTLYPESQVEMKYAWILIFIVI